MSDRKGFESVDRVGRRAWPLALAVVGTFVLVGAGATPARADSNFERGFENELGRVLAREAVQAGKHVLFGAVVHPAYYGSGHGYREPAYRHPPGHAYGHREKARVYRPYRPVPAHTHVHGARPYRYDDHRYYQEDRRHRKHYRKKLKNHRRYDRHHRHHDDCYDH